jgi:hypothetical protein
MQIDLREKNAKPGRDLAVKNGRSRHDKPRQGAPLEYTEIEEKMIVEIKTMFRVDLDRAPEVKRSFEKWAAQWE